MKHVWNTIGIILVVALVGGLAVDGYAKAKKKSELLMMAGMNRRVFSISSQYLGSLEDDIFVAGKRVYVPPKTPVYVVGKGIQEDGYFANDQRVYVTGAYQHGMAVAKMIVVQPTDTHSNRPGGSGGLVSEYTDAVPK